MPGSSFKSSTLAGLARAFRRWVNELPDPGEIQVAGASRLEQRRLAALGGVAAEVADRVQPGWDPAIREWMESSPTPPTGIVEATRQALRRDEDALGTLYNASISAAHRRRLGTVFTPPPLVEHMRELVEAELEAPPQVVVDPGAGVGAFTLAAARAWPDAQIVASDINPVTLGLLGARLAFEAANDAERATSYRNVDLRLADYLDELVRLFSADAPGPVLVLGNPPYTRVQELSTAGREKAARMAGDLIDSGHANLAMLFQAATLRHMRPNDVSCMVIPGSFSYTRASRALRNAMWASTRSIVVHRTPATSKVFTGRSVQAAVLVVGRRRHTRPSLQLARIELDKRGVKILDSWTVARGDDEPDNWFWSADRVGGAEPEALLLSEIAVVRRGTATGANRMFFLTDVTKATLPAEVVTPAIPTLRDFDGEELSAEAHAALGDAKTRRWLLAIPPTRTLDGNLLTYVESHREAVSQRHLPRQRQLWYAITELPRPQILISPLSKTSFKIVANTVRAVPSNNLFGITVNDQIDPAVITSWLRSEEGQRELRRVSRRYPGGSHKLEPRDVANARVPVAVVARATLVSGDCTD